MRRACLIAVAISLCAPAAGRAEPGDNPIALLAASDALRADARASGDPMLLLGALALLAKANGRVFLPGGLPADLGYQELWAETERAVRGDPRLEASLARLPAPDRGAGWQSQNLTLGTDGTWRGSIRYDGGEPAYLYAKARDGRAIRLTVHDASGSRVCDEGKSGYIICAWSPARTAKFAVSVMAPGGAGRGFQLFTN